MNIAFLTPEYPHPKIGTAGGIGTSIVHLSRGLVKLGHQVSILVYGRISDSVFVEDGITYYLIKNVKRKGFSLFLTQKKVTKLINSLVEANKIDIVEVPDWTGFASFVHPKCPMVMRLHGSDTYFCHLDGRPVKAKNKFLEKKAFKKVDGIISVSAFTGQLSNTLFGTNREITVIPNGIAIDQFTPSTQTTKPNTLLYFGTLIRKKGALELPLIFNKVIAQNPEAQLLLVGADSSDKQTGSNSTWALMQPLFSKEALPRVNYIGKVPYTEIQSYIKNATICVFPTFAEALPVSWIEAMAMEKAVVASNIGWAKELIDDDTNGFIVHPCEHQEYANKIVKLMNDAQLQRSFGKKAREKVIKDCSNEVVAKASVDYYATFLNTKLG